MQLAQFCKYMQFLCMSTTNLHLNRAYMFEKSYKQDRVFSIKCHLQQWHQMVNQSSILMFQYMPLDCDFAYTISCNRQRCTTSLTKLHALHV